MYLPRLLFSLFPDTFNQNKTKINSETAVCFLEVLQLFDNDWTVNRINYEAEYAE